MKFLSFIFCLMALFALSTTVSAQTAFTGTNTGDIPDGDCDGAGRQVQFNVSGVTGPITNVRVSFTATHSYVGDVDVVLIAPNGTTGHPIFIFTNPGQTDFGDSSTLAGTYNFYDQAMGNWWQAAAAAAANQPIPPGDYRTANSSGAQTLITPVFAALANPNGTWILKFNDCANQDTGTVSAATLTITTSTQQPVVRDANVDFNGDGKTDFVVARATNTAADESAAVTGVPLSKGISSARERFAKMREGGDKSLIGGFTPIYWFTSINGTGATSVGQLGQTGQSTGDLDGDFLVPEDYDGDGKDDIAVWRTGAPEQAAFYIYQSSNNTVRTEIFGQNGDDPLIVGDYDGDNKADPAVFRCPPASAGQCYFFYRGSLNNPSRITTFVPWGRGVEGDFFVNPGDFDGDGKFDFCLQRTRPGTTSDGQFVLLRSSDLGVEYVNWGTDTDRIVPGDYDGDGKFDFCVARNQTINGVVNLSFYILERDGGGTGASPIRFGLLNDFIAPGDYDGDGKQDIAVWRENSDPNQNYFHFRRSSDGVTQSFEWGKAGDYPVANWYVH
jgi:subtilisin-like proprotein convertase family protein